MKKIVVISFALLFIFLTTGAEKKKLTYSQKLEIEIHNLVNQERIKHKLKGFKYSKKLSSIARNHSRDMSKRNFTSHVNPDGLDPTARAKKAGYNVVVKTKTSKGTLIRTGVGENIFENYTEKVADGKATPFLEPVNKVAKKAVEGWMNSPGHRANILNKDYTLAGTGVAVSKDKKIKVTQVFF